MRLFFFFKQKTAYEWRISDWSSDVCSSDLSAHGGAGSHLCCSSLRASCKCGSRKRTSKRALARPTAPSAAKCRVGLAGHAQNEKTFAAHFPCCYAAFDAGSFHLDRKSTRLNSSH